MRFIRMKPQGLRLIILILPQPYCIAQLTLHYFFQNQFDLFCLLIKPDRAGSGILALVLFFITFVNSLRISKDLLIECSYRFISLRKIFINNYKKEDKNCIRNFSFAID